MTNVIITIALFDDLYDNTVECFNLASDKGNNLLADEYKRNLEQCDKIYKELSDDS